MVLSGFNALKAQDRFAALESLLKEASKQTPGLGDPVDLSVTNTPIQEFVRAIAASNNINVYVDPAIDVKISNNFTNVPARDVFLFLCKKYDLDITMIANILSFSKYAPPITPQMAAPTKSINVTYNSFNESLSLDLNNDSLTSVAKAITRKSRKNVVLAPDLMSKMVNGYIENMPFDNALDKFAFGNDLKVTKTEDNFYLVEKKDVAKAQGTGSTTGAMLGPAGKSPIPAGLSIKRESDSTISVVGNNVPIADVAAAVSAEMKNQYYLFSELKGNTSLNVQNVSYDKFLKNLLNGTDFTFKKQGELYLIGDRSIEGLRATKIVQLKFRSIDKIVDFIPADLKKGVDIKTFTDLNSLILSGSQPRINEIEAFLRDIDRVVPNISIDVIIVDVSDSKSLTTGIQAGIGTPPSATQSVFPGLDFNLSTSFINSVIDGINGFGNVNLGHVSPLFYVSLKALETNGFIKIRSTPRLATLNGHEAKLTIGAQQYYLETTTNVTGGINNTVSQGQNYKPVSADLSVVINPIVSGDEQITLDVHVKQSSFTEKIGLTAPPGTVTRDFQSLIRVKNEEMILLGGLEENSMNDSGTGTPLLSRIPVIKWLFSSRSKTKKKSKLTIFIKPTVVY